MPAKKKKKNSLKFFKRKKQSVWLLNISSWAKPSFAHLMKCRLSTKKLNYDNSFCMRMTSLKIGSQTSWRKKPNYLENTLLYLNDKLVAFRAAIKMRAIPIKMTCYHTKLHHLVRKLKLHTKFLTTSTHSVHDFKSYLSTFSPGKGLFMITNFGFR